MREVRNYAIEDVKQDFDKAGLILLTQEYKGVLGSYEYICKKHKSIGVQSIIYRCLQNRLKEEKYGCTECRMELRRTKRVISGIYKITNKVNDKVYIGQSNDIHERWSQHKAALNGNKHYNSYLQHAWNKHGKENFIFEIVCTADSQEKLDELERKYIEEYNSHATQNGYNIDWGGHSRGRMSEETKQKLSITKRGQHSNLSMDDVRKIKMLIYCGIDRKEIYEMFNTNRAVVTAICMSDSFGYILPELNEYINDIKATYRKERNTKILELFDSGMTITEICNETSLSRSVVEKVVYVNRETDNSKRLEQLEKYKKVFELHEQGIINYQIAKQLNISPSTVDRYLTKGQHPKNKAGNTKMTLEMSEAIFELYKQGVHINDIAEKYNVSDTTIRTEINKHINIKDYTYKEELVS